MTITIDKGVPYQAETNLQAEMAEVMKQMEVGDSFAVKGFPSCKVAKDLVDLANNNSHLQQLPITGKRFAIKSTKVKNFMQRAYWTSRVWRIL